jgi:hypothetical protein
MKGFLTSRTTMLLVTVAITASLTIMLGPARSTTPVLASGADKIAVYGATDQVINKSQVPDPTTDKSVELASTTFSTSTTEDLVINFSAECGLYTAVGAKNGGSNTSGVTTTSTATGEVDITVKLDGQVVQVSPNNVGSGPLNGPVTYCNRTLQLDTSNLSPSQLIALAETTMNADSFQWFSLNVGNGTHTLEVWASLIQTTASGGTGGGTGSCDPSTDAGCGFTTPAASAIVGQRTLEVFPDHLAPTASF